MAGVSAPAIPSCCGRLLLVWLYGITASAEGMTSQPDDRRVPLLPLQPFTITTVQTDKITTTTLTHLPCGCAGSGGDGSATAPGAGGCAGGGPTMRTRRRTFVRVLTISPINW